MNLIRGDIIDFIIISYRMGLMRYFYRIDQHNTLHKCFNLKPKCKSNISHSLSADIFKKIGYKTNLVTSFLHIGHCILRMCCFWMDIKSSYDDQIITNLQFSRVKYIYKYYNFQISRNIRNFEYSVNNYLTISKNQFYIFDFAGVTSE